MTELKLLGEWIKFLRKARNLTQERLAEICEFHYKFLGGIDRRERNPTISILQRIARGLNVTLADSFKYPKQEENRSTLMKKLDKILNMKDKEEFRVALKVLDAIFD
ncbi:MAG: helix-turn-helix transcriptional regulator [Acidobacteria bacterium]|nr:helix-turn-helix transcriptional regulator [Acidobacteriota bacterium]MBI3657260.1 helix-turn-helix transcriptional regulator [Acidobacteriota bacterium]